MRALRLSWKGVEYKLPASKVFAVADLVEDIVPMPQLAVVAQSLKIAKLAKVAGIILRAAGAKNVKDEDIYAEMRTERDSLILAANKGDDVDFGQDLLLRRVLVELTEILTDGAPDAEDGDDAEDDSGNARSAS